MVANIKYIADVEGVTFCRKRFKDAGFQWNQRGSPHFGWAVVESFAVIIVGWLDGDKGILIFVYTVPLPGIDAPPFDIGDVAVV